MRKKYETDLTDEQWDVIAPLFSHMRKYKWEKRELVNAVLYLLKTGCQTVFAFAYSTLKKICGDGGYRGSFVYEAHKYFDLQAEISKKLKGHVRQVLPKRRIVERTFAWLNHSRRFSKNYELTISSADTLIKISHIHTLLKRL